MVQTPEWVWRLHREVARYAIPFSFGHPLSSKEPPDIHSGTCVTVQIGASAFLVSAHHVVGPALEAVVSAGLECRAGNLQLRLAPDKVHLTDLHLDLATIELTEAEVAAIETDGYRVVRPEKWPPPDLLKGDPLISIGYPGKWRRYLSWEEIDFQSGSSLSLIHALREDEFVCQLDPAFVEQHDADPPQTDLSNEDIEGMSGGPAFLVRQQELLVIPTLCGILKEGGTMGGASRFLYFSRLERIKRDGTIDA